jgi:hypothetical protein
VRRAHDPPLIADPVSIAQRHRSRAALALLAVVVAACAGSGPSSSGGGGQTCKPPAQPSVLYATNIQPIYNRSCATSNACHVGATAGAGLQLTQGVSFGATVNVHSTQQPRLFLVKPGDPDTSYLVRKIEGGPNISGLQMPQGCPGTPLGGSVCPSNDEITAIRTWITECAQNN